LGQALSISIGNNEFVRKFDVVKSLTTSPLALVDATALDAVDKDSVYDYFYIPCLLMAFSIDGLPTAMSFTSSRKIQFLMRAGSTLYEIAPALTTGSSIYFSLFMNSNGNTVIFPLGSELEVVGTGLTNQNANQINFHIVKVFGKKA
jgi:hypothetical protein